MKAYVAVQRKLLVLIYTLWKKDQEYISDYVQQKQTFEMRRRCLRDKTKQPRY